MGDGDRTLIFFLILFEIILFIMCIINSYYYYGIYNSNNSVISKSTAQGLAITNIVFAVLLFICLIASIAFLRNENSRSEEINKLNTDIAQIDNNKADSKIDKIKKLQAKLKTCNDRLAQQSKDMMIRDDIITKKDNEIESLNYVLRNKVRELDEIRYELESVKEKIEELPSDLFRDDSSDSDSDVSEEINNIEEQIDNIEDQIDDAEDEIIEDQDSDDDSDDDQNDNTEVKHDFIIPADADDEDEVEDSKNIDDDSNSLENILTSNEFSKPVKKPGVKWNENSNDDYDGGSFVEKILRRSQQKE